MDICKSFDLADCLDARCHLEEISTSADGTTSTDCGTVYLLVHMLIPAGLEQSLRPDLLGENFESVHWSRGSGGTGRARREMHF